MGLILFLLFPFLEVYLWYLFIDEFGFLMAIAEVFLSAWLGITILRFRGLLAMATVQKTMNDVTAKNMAQNSAALFLVFAGSVLIMLPGILTDVFGLLLIFPLTRKLFGHLILKRFSTMVSTPGGGVRIFSVGNKSGSRIFTEEDIYGYREKNKNSSQTNGTIIDVVPNEDSQQLDSSSNPKNNP